MLHLAVVALVDVVAGERAVLIGLLSIGPFIASFGGTQRATAGVGATAVALAIGVGWPNEIIGTLDHAIRVSVVLVAASVAVAFVGLRTQREDALRRVTQVAQVAQRAILREPPPRIAHVRIAGAYVSAADEALVGGDLYETALTPFGVRVIVGDVRGKGLEAIGLAARVLSAFRENALQCEAISDLALAIDKDVSANVDDEEFVTGALVEFAFGDELVRIVNCGHHPPLRVSEQLEPTFLASGAADLPFGLGPSAVETEYGMRTGDRLLLYTDGLVEARSATGEEFSLAGRAHVLLQADVRAAVAALLDDLREHVGHRFTDDLAVLLCERLHEA